MKPKVFLSLFLLLVFYNAFSEDNSEEDTLKKKIIHHVGIYGLVNGEMTWIKDDPELFLNGSVGIMFNERLYIGPFIFTQLTKSLLGEGMVARMSSVGGLAGYAITSHKRLHVDIGIKVGVAKIYPKGDFDSKIDRVGLTQPEVSLNYQLAHWCKLRGALGYRFYSDVFEPYFEQGDLNSLTLSFGVLLGKFH